MRTLRKTLRGKQDDEAVSPVIATILMVAVTVVLAATAYFFATGFGAPGSNQVSASFAVEGGDDQMTITYLSGPRLNEDEVTIRINDLQIDDGGHPDWVYDAGNPEPATWEVGESALIVPNAGGADPEDSWDILVLVRDQVVHRTTVDVF